MSDVLDLLRSLEWCASSTSGAAICPCCEAHEHGREGHAPDCRLDLAIREMADDAAPHPTPDEMAREMGMDRDHGGFYGRTVNGDAVEAYAPKDIPPLYREHKAKRVRLVIDPASPMLNEPPTDPSALAAWLYGRVVPGHTVVEWTEPGVDRIRTRKAFISALEQDVDHIVLWPHGDSALYVPPPANHTHRATKLVNPDGTVLWESS
jgi:hypothetical protein